MGYGPSGSPVGQEYLFSPHWAHRGDPFLQGRGAVFAIANSCMPVEHMNDPRKGFHFDMFSILVKSRGEMSDIDSVFIGFNTWWSYNRNGICPSVNGKCIPKRPAARFGGCSFPA